MNSTFRIVLEQKLTETHLASLVISRNNKIGMLDKTRVGEFIKQFDHRLSRANLCICVLVRQHVRWINKPRTRMVEKKRKELIRDAYFLDDKSSSNNIA